MEDAAYVYEDGLYRPTRWAGSPWSPTMQHGAPVIGLFAREAERRATDLGMQVARLTVDLFKAVPLKPLVVATRIVRQGSRISALETTLHAHGDDRPVSRASALLLRPKPHGEPFWTTADSPPPPAADVGPVEHPGVGSVELPRGFHEAVDIRSGVDDAGPFVWLTTPLDLVRGEPISDLQRASALTDMTLGTQMRMAQRRRASSGSTRSARGGVMINTDTTVYWERPFVGDQLGLRPALIAERDGVGAAEAILYDVAGRVGRSLQSALVHSFGL